MRTALLTDPRFLQHDNGPRHPERAARLEAIWAELRERGLWERLTHPEFAPAPEDVLTACHTPEHIALIRRLAEQGDGQIDPDTRVSPDSFEVASLAVGAACAALDTVLQGQSDNAFVVARPPGHHATAERAMGFCLFNTIACAARYAQRRHGLERVAILDWDVHHGNGTQDIFYDDLSVLFVSLHQAPLYPYSGATDKTGNGEGEGFTFNVPLRAGQGDVEYQAVWSEWVAPRVRDFAPQLILVSAGYDAHANDPLGGMNVTAEGFAALTRQTKEWAAQLCGDNLVCVLEGGYDLQSLSDSVAGTIEVLLDE